MTLKKYQIRAQRYRLISNIPKLFSERLKLFICSFINFYFN